MTLPTRSVTWLGHSFILHPWHVWALILFNLAMLLLAMKRRDLVAFIAWSAQLWLAVATGYHVRMLLDQ